MLQMRIAGRSSLSMPGLRNPTIRRNPRRVPVTARLVDSWPRHVRVDPDSPANLAEAHRLGEGGRNLHVADDEQYAVVGLKADLGRRLGASARIRGARHRRWSRKLRMGTLRETISNRVATL